MLIGTAGHVNHGKTSLVRALTGIDTDRLPEEKRRGLTIDLGYAYAERPGGRIVGFVDVPGHDHYLHNMIAGVLPLDCVLLVVAADEGLAQQTREHLEILDLIGTKRLIVAITKTDRAGDAAVTATEERLREAMSRTSFAGAAFFRVSSETGEGIAALQQHLDTLPLEAGDAASDAGFRMPIDRAFTLPGIGTVVTGTVIGGTVHAGDRLVLTPSGTAVRVRSLHAQNRPAASASAGVRCAAAISGPLVEKDKIKRGEVLVAPSLHMPSEKIGASLKLADGVSLRGDRTLQLYHGTGRTPVRLRIVDRDAGPWLVEFTPARPLPMLYGDRVLLRDEGAKENIAGGIVIDPFAPARKSSRDARAAILLAAARPDRAEALAALLDAAGFVDFKRFCLARNLPASEIEALAARFADDLSGDVILSKPSRERAKSRLIEGLAQYHRKRPQSLGPRKEEALALMGRQFAGSAAETCLAEAIAEGLVIRDGACIRLETHRAHLAEEDQAIWDKLQSILQSAGLRPPHTGALAERLGLDWKEMESCLLRLEQFGLLTRVARNRFFLPETIDRFRDIAAERVREEGSFTAAAFNERSGVGRNLTIEILEYLDRIGVTKRDGPNRRLL